MAIHCWHLLQAVQMTSSSLKGLRIPVLKVQYRNHLDSAHIFDMRGQTTSTIVFPVQESLLYRKQEYYEMMTTLYIFKQESLFTNIL